MGRAQERQIWVDATKGLAIILVVIGHAWRGIEAAGLLKDTPGDLFSAIDARIYAFHMPLFFLLSGLFIVQTLTERPVSDYVKSRLARLLYPLLLWTYIFAITKTLAGGLANDPIGVQEVFASPVPGRWHFWFLWALLLLQLGLLVLRPALRAPRWRRQTLWGLFVASLVLQVLPLTHAVHYWTSNALRYLPYLALGLLLAEFGPGRFGITRHGLAWLALFILVLALVSILDDMGFPKVVTAGVLCLSLIGGVIGGTCRFPAAAKGLAVLGTYSMIIFLSHTIFSAGMREALIIVGVQGIALHMGLATLAGLVLPVLLQQGFARLASPRLLGA